MSLRDATLVATVLLMLSAGGAAAQSSSGAIHGQVVDDLGAPLAGVSVSLASPSLQGARAQTTDAEGEFRFKLLPPATYTAVFTVPGHRRLEQEEIRVTMESVITLQIELARTTADEVVVTADSPAVDVTSAAVSTSLDRELISSLPLGRNVGAATALVGGVVDGRLGAPSILGAPAVETGWVVTELEVTHPTSGLLETRIPADFVDEVQVKVAGVGVAHSGASGGVINLATRTGGNQLHGEVFGYVTADGLVSDPRVPASRGGVATPEREADLGFALGGKLVADRIWYFVAYDPLKIDDTVRQEIYDQNGALVQRHRIEREETRHRLAATLTWRTGDSSSLGITVFGDPGSSEDDPGRTTSFFMDVPWVDASSELTDADLGGVGSSIRWSSGLSERLFVETSASHRYTRERFRAQLDTAGYQDQTVAGDWSLRVGDGVHFGGASLQQPHDERTRDQLRLALIWLVGRDHELTIGGDHRATGHRILHQLSGPSDPFCAPAHPDGVLSFDSAGGGEALLTYDCDRNGDGELDGVMMPARLGNRYVLRDGSYSNHDYSAHFPGRIRESSLFVEDSWRLTDALIVRFGLRAESVASSGEASAVADLPPDLDPGLDLGFGDLVAPRLGVVWDAAGTGRSRVFAHYGRYLEPIPLRILLRTSGGEREQISTFTYPEGGGLPSTTDPGLLTTISTFGRVGVDRDLDPPHVDELVLGAEYELMTGIVTGLTYIRRELGAAVEEVSLDGGRTSFITNPGRTFDVNPATGLELGQPVTVPEASRRFEGVALSAGMSVFSDWQVHTSLLWSRLDGNTDGLCWNGAGQADPYRTSGILKPELLENADGKLANDHEWQLETYGSYLFDFGLATGFRLSFLSGSPISKLGADRVSGLDQRFVTRRGSEGRTPSWWNLDLRFSYPFSVGGSKLEGMLDVLNLFNRQVALEMDQRWTVRDPSQYPGGEVPADEGEPRWQTNPRWGEALRYSPPRTVRLGLKFSW